MNWKTNAVLMLATAVLSAAALAQRSTGPTTLTVHPLRGGVYWIQGGVANTGFIVGDRGVIAFDAQQTPEDARKELAAIAQITPKPVNEIVLSHADPDHIGGLPAFPSGAEVIASENTRSIIVVSATEPANGSGSNSAAQASQNTFQPIYKGLVNLLPTRTISSPRFFVLDGVPIVLAYLAPAHTSGDLFAYLPQQKIVFCGDLLTPSFSLYPIIHVGGSSQGWIDNIVALLALDVDTYVSGHGEVLTKDDLRTRLQAAQQRRDQVKALVDQHKSYQEVKQALPEAASSLPFPTFTQTTFNELVQGYPPSLPPWDNFGIKQ